MSGFPFDDGDRDDLHAESSPEILDDLRAMGAISADEARRHSEPTPAEPRIPWEERLRQPSRSTRTEQDLYTEQRFLKDIAYGRNRDGPALAPRRPGRPVGPASVRGGTPGVSFEPRPNIPRPPQGPPARTERPRGGNGARVVLRPSQIGPQPAPVRPITPPALPPTPRSLQPEGFGEGFPLPGPRRMGPGGVPEYPYPSSLEQRKGPSPAARALEERHAAESLRGEEERKAEFVREFRRSNPKASESDAETVYEARRRASTIDT